VLETSRIPIAILFLALVITSIGLHAFFPTYLAARLLLGLAILWTASRGLKRHCLSLNIEEGTYRYDHGWFLAPPTRHGTFDAISAVAIAVNGTDGEPETHRLRSRLIVLEFEDWEDGGSFVLGFPMGPKVAADKAADYAQRLGTKLIDRTLEPVPPLDEASSAD